MITHLTIITGLTSTYNCSDESNMNTVRYRFHQMQVNKCTNSQAIKYPKSTLIQFIPNCSNFGEISAKVRTNLNDISMNKNYLYFNFDKLVKNLNY